MEKKYDLIIAGGGLAGLTLSIQLKKQKPSISILILEARQGLAPLAAHKVGESTVELATHYFREVLEIKDYLEEFELPKHGLRFFFKSKNKEDITSRVELGPRLKLPTPSHQLDRGTLENYLEKLTQDLGNTVILGAKVKDVDLDKENGHEVTYILDRETKSFSSVWFVDATSRNSLLKRKLKFQKPMEHAVNAVWWRVKGVVDIDDWSENKTWKNFLEPKLRYLSTVHFMDKGYWVWIIPLGTKNTSIGIVADPDIHPFEEINRYDRSLSWLEKNEPLCYKMLKPFGEGDGLLDFKVLKHFAHDSGRLYSEDRWAVTGEAGAFLDPLYSPGSDFISLNNNWVTDLILRDLNGENIGIRANIYEQAHKKHLENWIPIYLNKYKLMGNSQIMVLKIFWDWAIYWSVTSTLFTNKAYTNLQLLKAIFVSPTGLGARFGKLNLLMQQLFLDWLPFENEVFENKYIDPFDLSYMRTFQEGIEVQLNDKDLLIKIEKNIEILEQVAVGVFQKIKNQVDGSPLDMAYNPYSISLKNLEINDLASRSNAILPNAEISKDISVMWFY
jgi:flavin-dependent dehydrogenase